MFLYMILHLKIYDVKELNWWVKKSAKLKKHDEKIKAWHKCN